MKSYLIIALVLMVSSCTSCSKKTTLPTDTSNSDFQLVDEKSEDVTTDGVEYRMRLQVYKRSYLV
jgi:starvation-inducible outer membrane lipoprotein